MFWNPNKSYIKEEKTPSKTRPPPLSYPTLNLIWMRIFVTQCLMEKGSCPCCLALWPLYQQGSGETCWIKPWQLPMGEPADSLEMLNFLPNQWFIRSWLLILGFWLLAQGQCCLIPEVGCGGSSDCLFREVETLLPVCRITSQTSKIEKEAYHMLEINNNWELNNNFGTLNTCLPLCLLFFRLAARKEVMPWTLPLIKWPRRPETCAGR